MSSPIHERLSQIRTQVETNIQEFVSTMPEEFKQALESVEAPYRKIQEEDVPVDSSLLYLLFFHPQLAVNMQYAMLNTMSSFFTILKNDPLLPSEETMFLINHQPGIGITMTTPVQKLSRPISPDREYTVTEDPHRQSLAMFHTHPPAFANEILKPSTFEEVQAGSGKFKGDLYAFLTMGRMRRESIEEGERAAFTDRPISIIMEQSLEDGSGKMLFIRESKGIKALSDEEYLALIKKNVEPISESTSEEETASLLRNMGYHVSYLTIPAEILYAYPMIEKEEDYVRLKKELFDE